MNQAITKGWLSEAPADRLQRYIFLVDRVDRAENIFAAGFRSVMVAEDQPGFFALAALADFLNRPETMASRFLFVLSMSTKTRNDETRSALKGFDTVDGWRIFYKKDFFASPDHVEDLQKALNDFVDQLEGPRQENIKLSRLSEIQERPAEWLIAGYIPRSQITLLCGDGGCGKTSIWANLAAAVSTGKKSIFEEQVPFDIHREPADVLFFSGEDSVETVLKSRLEKAGVDASRIMLLDITDPNFKKIKIGSPALEKVVADNRPALLIVDPIQSFLPVTLDLSSRNQVRQSMETLIELAAKYETTVLGICHSNKRSGVSGRKRMADSADLWDISRSVLIAGKAEDGFYCSHEKSNYGPMQSTILYRLDDGIAKYSGTTDLKDADFVSESARPRPAPARNEARALIMDYLKDGQEHPVSDLDDNLRAAGVSMATLKRAKQDMKQDGILRFIPSGFGPDKRWFVKLAR